MPWRTTNVQANPLAAIESPHQRKPFDHLWSLASYRSLTRVELVSDALFRDPLRSPRLPLGDRIFHVKKILKVKRIADIAFIATVANDPESTTR